MHQLKPVNAKIFRLVVFKLNAKVCKGEISHFVRNDNMRIVSGGWRRFAAKPQTFSNLRNVYINGCHSERSEESHFFIKNLPSKK